MGLKASNFCDFSPSASPSLNLEIIEFSPKVVFTEKVEELCKSRKVKEKSSNFTIFAKNIQIFFKGRIIVFETVSTYNLKRKFVWCEFSY